MKPWIADYLVESEFTLAAGDKKIQIEHPKGLYTLQLSRPPAQPAGPHTLSCQIFVDAPDIATAEKLTDERLKEALHVVSFVTCCPLRVSRRIALIDWSAGTFMREAYVYSGHSKEPPEEGLSSSILKTVEIVENWKASPSLKIALRWFAFGVRSKTMEDQFQYFWFVIEQISTDEESEKITDRCTRCGGDLHCAKCGEVSRHRPFEKQKISAVLSRLGLSQQLIDDLFYVRNALLHGTPRDQIEKEIHSREPAFSFDKAVNVAGRAARDLILNKFEKPPGRIELQFLNVNTFVDWNLSAKAHVQIGVGGDPNNPQIEHVMLPAVSINSFEGTGTRSPA
jgi:hypothetical protein